MDVCMSEELDTVPALDELTEQVTPGFRARQVVFWQYEKIGKARANGWRWKTIAKSVGLPVELANDLRYAYFNEKYRREKQEDGSA